MLEISHILHMGHNFARAAATVGCAFIQDGLGLICGLFDRLRTMVKMARSHTSGQHALSCTAVEPGQLNAAEWRLRHSGCVVARVAPGHGLGFAVSQARQPCRHSHTCILHACE
jgi:hypothetical protein